MANRHLSRSIVLQTLFESDSREINKKEVEDILIRNTSEFGAGTSDTTFMMNLLETTLGKKTEIDKIITKAAPDWPLDKISTVDRNVLRIGLAELIFADRSEVPAKVAINEAIELAKNFGGESSGKFVNGVLGAVYKELGEPGKDEQSKKVKEVSFEEMPIEKKAGAVVFAKNEGDIYVALVHDVFGHWTLSKGSPENDETDEEAAIREIKEEMGIDIKISDMLGKNEYVANHPEKGKIRKQVIYFLGEATYKELTLGESGGLDDARWFKLGEILDLNFYDDILPIVTDGVKKIAKITESAKK
jgi:N utilization substance protein B